MVLCSAKIVWVNDNDMVWDILATYSLFSGAKFNDNLSHAPWFLMHERIVIYIYIWEFICSIYVLEWQWGMQQAFDQYGWTKFGFTGHSAKKWINHIEDKVISTIAFIWLSE